MKKGLFFLVVILLCFVLYSCDETEEDNRSFSLGMTSCQIEKESFVELNPVLEGIEGEIEWSSSNDKIAVVFNNRIVAKEIGSCTIYGKIGDLQQSVNVTVIAGDDREISFSKYKELTFKNDSEKEITITKNNKVGTLTIYSSDTSIARVEVDSSSNTDETEEVFVTVYPLSNGSCNIIIEFEDLVKTISVVVSAFNSEQEVVKSINFDSNSFEIIEGQTKELHVTMTNITGELTWYSYDDSIVTVNNGVITAHKVGRCTIKASCDGVSAKIVVIIKDKYYLTDELFLNMQFCDLTIGETKNIVVMNKALEGNISYSSSNTSIAYVSNGAIKAIKAGKCTITVKVGSLTKTIEVTVKAKSGTQGEI